MQVRHKTFKNYSGPHIYGEKTTIRTDTINHVNRAVILTEGVETGYRPGSIMAADGTAMTAGCGQHILVYPRELANEDFNAKDDQGTLSSLLRELELVAPVDALAKLFGAFIAESMYVAKDGRLRFYEDTRAKVKGRWVDCKAGDIVHGAIIRDIITPLGGKVPKTGERWEQAKRWAVLFYDVFSDPDTFSAQLNFETDHLCYRVNRFKYLFHPNRRKETVAQVVYGNYPVEIIEADNQITPELDLAMCVFHSHSVNAPAIAYRKLKEAILATEYVPDILSIHNRPDKEVKFARNLLRRLAKANYGRWNEKVHGGRWIRTRTCARTSEMWPPEFFKKDGIMPLKF